jgi:hypothetical protein
MARQLAEEARRPPARSDDFIYNGLCAVAICVGYARKLQELDALLKGERRIVAENHTTSAIF